MASQKTRPDPGTLERRERGQGDRSPRGRIGAYGGLAAALVVVAVVVTSLFALASGDGTPEAVQPGQPSATGAGTTGQTTGSTHAPPEVAEESTGFLPEGIEPAAREHGKSGKLVMKDTGVAPQYSVYVFADGRVIWRRRTGGVRTTTPGWLERRLTPKGIELIRAGAKPDMGESSNPKLLDPFGLPAGAWEDPWREPYRASHYAVCPSRSSAATIWRQLPARARDLLRGSEGIVRGSEPSVGFNPDEYYSLRCLMVTTEDARRLEQFLVNDGFKRDTLWKGLREYRIGAMASVGIFAALPNATFEVWS